MHGVQGEKIGEEETVLTRVKRESCDPEGAQQCATDATNIYMAAMFENGQKKAVPTGEKPDYYERKMCNLLLDTEKCFEQLESCDSDKTPADQVKKLKDASLKHMREMGRQLPNWKEEKCKSSGASFCNFLVLGSCPCLICFQSLMIILLMTEHNQLK